MRYSCSQKARSSAPREDSRPEGTRLPLLSTPPTMCRRAGSRSLSPSWSYSFSVVPTAGDAVSLSCTSVEGKPRPVSGARLEHRRLFSTLARSLMPAAIKWRRGPGFASQRLPAHRQTGVDLQRIGRSSPPLRMASMVCRSSHSMVPAAVEADLLGSVNDTSPVPVTRLHTLCASTPRWVDPAGSRSGLLLWMHRKAGNTAG